MDSKSGFPANDNEAAAPPPAYSDSSYNTFTSPSSSTSQYYSAQIQSQLSSLTTQISSLHTQAELLSNAQDEKILSLLTNDIQIYLSDFAKSGMKKGTLILVPSAGLQSENATPTDHDFKEMDEFDRVVRVKDKEGEREEKWFWGDEEMANRLAGYLRPPPPDPRTLDLPPRKEVVKPKVEASSSRGFWGRKKSVTLQPAVLEPRPVLRNVKEVVKEDKVVMDVNAEEVCFRTENDFGILETERGYAVVVKLKVILVER